MCIPGTLGNQRALDILDFDLEIIISQYVGFGKSTQVLCKSRKCS